MDDGVELLVDLPLGETEQSRAEIDVLAFGQLWMKSGAELDQRDDVSADAHNSARRPGDAGNQLEQGRLAGAVASDDAEAGADRNVHRDIAQRPDRRADPSARGAVHIVALPSQRIDLRRDEVAKRPRPPGAVLLGDLLELNGDG